MADRIFESGEPLLPPEVETFDEHMVTRDDLRDLLAGLPLPATREQVLAHAEARRPLVANPQDALAILRRLPARTYRDLRGLYRDVDDVR